jgi:hypothetical protein
MISLASHIAQDVMFRPMKKNPAAQALGSAGGTARARKLSAKELSEIGRAMAKQRAKKLTPEQRSEIARTAVQARIKKLGQKTRKGKKS